MEQLVPLPALARLSPRVIRILGHNPGKFTLQGTNIYLIGTGRSRLLLDTGDGTVACTKSLDTLLREDLKLDVQISDILLTHWHHDHVGGIPTILDLLKRLHPSLPLPKLHKRWSPPVAEPFAGEAEASIVRRTRPSDEQFCDIPDGKVFTTEGATLTACFAPGHTDDHTCFWLHEEEMALFAGDAVLGQGTTVFENLGVYISSLRRLISQHRPSRVYPGHGPVVEDGVAKITEYIRHRQDREDQIVEALRRNGVEGGLTTAELVADIYRGYPSGVLTAAERGLALHLQKLENEGRVVKVGGGKWTLR